MNTSQEKCVLCIFFFNDNKRINVYLSFFFLSNIFNEIFFVYKNNFLSRISILVRIAISKITHNYSIINGMLKEPALAKGILLFEFIYLTVCGANYIQ